MRTLIKYEDYTFSGDTRTISVLNNDSFTLDDIRLIVNETQKVVICSSMQKDNVTGVTNNEITYSSSLPALQTGDKLTIEIDFGVDSSTQYDTYTVTTNKASFSVNITKNGIISNVNVSTGATVVQISKNGIPQALSFPVSVNDTVSVTISGDTYPYTVIIKNKIIQDEYNITVSGGTSGTIPFANPITGIYCSALNKFFNLSYQFSLFENFNQLYWSKNILTTFYNGTYGYTGKWVVNGTYLYITGSSYAINTFNVYILDLQNKTEVTRLLLGNSFGQVVYSTLSNKIYASWNQWTAAQVKVFDGSSYSNLANISTYGTVVLEYVSSLNYVWSMYNRQVEIIDCSTDTKITTLNNFWSNTPKQTRYDNINDRVYASIIFGSIQIANPTTNTVVATIPTDEINDFILHDNHIWCTTSTNSLLKISMITNSIVSTYALGAMYASIVYNPIDNSIECYGAVYQLAGTYKFNVDNQTVYKHYL